MQMSDSGPRFEYDSPNGVLHVGLTGIRFDSIEKIRSTFAAIRSYWRTTCNGRKVYAIIDYTDVEIEPKLLTEYAAEVKTVVEECTVTTVRYTTDLLMRTTIRRMGMMLHKPSNLYATREAALEIVDAIRSEQIAVDNSF
jgi:hypothetical protein